MSRSSRPPPTVLVVEDNPVTRKMLRVTLEAEGYEVVLAADGAEALARAEERAPDLVLQDLILPDADGFEVRNGLQSLPGMAGVPIVALSGFASLADEERAGRAGFSAVLTKPMEPSRLVESMRLLLPIERSDAAPGAGRTILVVDDDSIQLKLTCIHLTQLGFSVRTSGSATEALRSARLALPDAILSDALMPDVDGFQLCFEVRSDPKLAHLPFVLVSAHYQGDADRNLARRVGASALVLRTPDFAPAILRALNSGVAPLPTEQPSDRVRLEHAQAVIRQLDRQLALSSGLARRCSLQAAQLQLLGGVAEGLSRRSDTSVALRDVLSSTLDVTAISKGALFLVDSLGALRLEHAIGFTHSEEAALRGFFGQLELLEEVLLRRSVASLPSPAFSQQAASSILAQAGVAHAEIVPLVSEGRSIGALVLGAKRTDVTAAESVAFARAIGNQIVQSLELQASFGRLTSSEQRYRILMESANDAIAVISGEGIIREVNLRAAVLMGVSKSEIVGRHVRDFTPLGQASVGRGPFELKRPDGSKLMVEFSGTPVVVAGEQLLLTIARDVTEQLQAQAQLMVSDRMASIGALAASVAHEVNNPLAAVIANLDLIATGFSDLTPRLASVEGVEDIEHEIRDAREAAGRVRSVVQDLRMLSRESDDACEAVDVHRVLDSALRMAANEIRHRARLTRAYGDVPLVLADEARLGQVFLNLLVNAAQAIADGHADTNEITVRTSSDASGRVVVEIADTGSGMTPEVQKQLFVPFFSTKPAEVGTGLGLTICQRLLSAMAGEISVESELRRGTVFRVSLARALGEERVSSEPPAAIHARRRGRVLIVDDDEMIGKVIRRLFKREHDVTFFTSAQAALDGISAGQRFDVILCDLMMPVITGMDLHAKLLTVAPDQAGCMVFLTGGAFTLRSRTFLSEVGNLRIEKPFDNERLRRLVNERLQ